MSNLRHSDSPTVQHSVKKKKKNLLKAPDLRQPRVRLGGRMRWGWGVIEGWGSFSGCLDGQCFPAETGSNVRSVLD